MGEPEAITSEQAKEAFDGRMYGLADWLFMDSFSQIEFWNLTTRGKGWSGRAIPQRLFADAEGNVKTPAAERLLLRMDNNMNMMLCLTSFWAWRRGWGEHTPPCDTWVSHVMATTGSRCSDRPSARRTLLDTWYIWASSIVFDITWNLGDYAHNGFEELKQNAMQARQTIVAYREWTSSLGSHPTGSLEEGLHFIDVFVAEHIEKDGIKEDGKRSSNKLVQNSPDHLMFYKNPVWCGVLLFWIRIVLWRVSIDVTNTWLIIFANTHLYNTALVGTDNSWSWPDMEYVIDLHGPEHLFVGGRPVTLEQCGPRLDLAAGTAHFQHRSAKDFQNGQRLLRSDALVSHMLAPRYWAKDVQSRGREVANASLSASELLIAFHRRLQQSPRSVTQSGNGVYLIPSLDQIREVIDDEWRHLQFDYLGLQRRCFQLLEQLRDGVSPAIQGTVNMILETEQQKQDRMESLPMRIVDSLSSAAAESTESFAEEHGAEGTTQALEALVRDIELMPKRTEVSKHDQKQTVLAASDASTDITTVVKRNNKNKNKNRKARHKEQNAVHGDSSLLSNSRTLTMASVTAALPELARTGHEEYTYDGVDDMSLAAMRAMGITIR